MARGRVPKGLVKDIIIVVIGVAVIWLGLKFVFGTDNPFFVVSSGSMVPELQVYDVLVVNGNLPFDEVEVGDVIVFNRPSDHDRVIVHRIVSIIDEDPLTIRTKGDANPASIPGTDFPVTGEEYIGQVIYVIPQVGYITRILTPPVNYIIIAIIIGIMIVKQVSKKRKQKEELLFSEPFDPQNEGTKADPLVGEAEQEEEKGESNKNPEDNEYVQSSKKIQNLNDVKKKQSPDHHHHQRSFDTSQNPDSAEKKQDD